MVRLAMVSLAWAMLAGCAGIMRPGSALAAEQVSCPATLQTTQAATDAMSPWSASQQGRSSRLLYIEVYAGPWRNEQSVPPDDVQEAPGEQTLLWRLRGRPSAEGTWLVCTYQNTQVKLERRLPDSVTECRQVDSTDPKRVVKVVAQGCK